MTDRELMQQALEALENFARFQRMMMDGPDVSDKLLAEDYAEAGFLQGAKTIPALRERLAQPEQEPVAWAPIEQPYPLASKLDILMGDGSTLCGVLPQAEGDLWWPGMGEKFIDPQYANVTHWRIHSNTAPPRREWVGLTEEAVWNLYKNLWIFHPAEEPRLAGDILKFYRAIEAKLREKNDQSIVSGS